MKKNFMMYATAALMLAGCAKEDNIDNWNGEIRLTSGVTTPTRAFEGMDIQIPRGKIVTVYVDKVGDTEQLYGNHTLTADGDGKLEGNPMYFPEDGSNVDIYAFHTNGTLAGSFPTTAITHTVNKEQNEEANYLNSDLLYAVSKDVKRTKENVPLTFYHMLSKVRVALLSGEGSPSLSGATVTILNTQLKADFTPDKTKDITKQVERAGMIKISSNDNNSADITISATPTSGSDFTSQVYNDAIIVPQAITEGTLFIKVHLQSGGDLFYKIPAGGITFESGKKYHFHITVNLTGLTVSSKIENWDPIAAIEGTAEME